MTYGLVFFSDTIMSVIIDGVATRIISDYASSRFKRFLLKPKDEEVIVFLKDKKHWSTQDGQSYFYKKAPEYLIKVNEPQDVLSDRFKRFPDRSNDSLSWVEVKYNDAHLLGWNFMHLDGFRILVPVPRLEYDTNANPYYYYDLSSVEIKIFEIIGEANLMREDTKLKGLNRVAGILDIYVVDM